MARDVIVLAEEKEEEGMLGFVREGDGLRSCLILSVVVLGICR